MKSVTEDTYRHRFKGEKYLYITQSRVGLLNLLFNYWIEPIYVFWDKGLFQCKTLWPLILECIEKSPCVKLGIVSDVFRVWIITLRFLYPKFLLYFQLQNLHDPPLPFVQYILDHWSRRTQWGNVYSVVTVMSHCINIFKRSLHHGFNRRTTL